MKKYKHYLLIIAMTLTSCATQKHQQQQSTQKETRQLHVTTKADSIQWNGHIGNWSIGLKAGRYELRLDSSTKQQQDAKSIQLDKHSNITTYVWWLIGTITLLIAVYWGIKRWVW